MSNNKTCLKRELKRILKLRRVTMVPVIIGAIITAIETVSKGIDKWLAEIGVTCLLEPLKRACLITGYSQNPSQSLRHLRSRAVTLMFKADFSKPSRSCV